MKIVEIVAYYPIYIEKFYSENPEVAKKSFSEQMDALNYDSAGWSDFWRRALAPSGYDVHKIILNAHSMQRAWCRENGFDGLDVMRDFNSIGLEQVKKYKPDIILYNHYDKNLLDRIRAEAPSVKLVLCWVGSAIPESGVWPSIDVILSCAPETVEYFRSNGYENAFHMHHGFDPLINDRLPAAAGKSGVTFVGQLTRQSHFHLNRDAILESLVKKVELQMYSPSVDSASSSGDIDFTIRKYSYKIMNMLKRLGISENFLARVPKIGKAALWKAAPVEPVNPVLRERIKPGVFGLKMYGVIRDSLATINIHADSSPRYASNMRLFEATGVGCCLVTDWRPNMAELFEPGIEVVTYKSVDECVERVEWLLKNPEELKKIAAAGMRRCLKDHTFAQRAAILDGHIKSGLRRKYGK